MNKVYGLVFMMVVCIILVPVSAYVFGEWYTYWGHALLAVVFGVLAVFARTHFYWEED